MVDTLVPREDVVEALEKHKLENLPVVDISGRLIGVIRHDILIQAVEEEATVDLLTMVGAGGMKGPFQSVACSKEKATLAADKFSDSFSCSGSGRF